jgi:hypothetical protein
MMKSDRQLIPREYGLLDMVSRVAAKGSNVRRDPCPLYANVGIRFAELAGPPPGLVEHFLV